MCEEYGVTECEMNTDTQTGDEEGLVHVAMFAGAEPISQTEALKKSVWKDVMREEVDSVRKNGIWKLVNILAEKKKSVEGNAAKEAWGVTGERRHGEHQNTRPQHLFNQTGRRSGVDNCLIDVQVLRVSEHTVRSHTVRSRCGALGRLERMGATSMCST
ncbi:hypothetical protein V8G54_003356 [Vigna mungo]|uniref:Uncharacterized protein n=1 Tax=Vigna mungo TaxID=3915 RepID=A0AAQ3SBN5_VIGMU